MSLKLTNISADIGGFRLKKINLEITRGDYHLIAGPSGAGKSLLLELICGVYKPENGRIELNGQDITFNPMQSRRIGLLFQDNTLFPHLNVYDNIAYSLKLKVKQQAWLNKRVEELADELDIRRLLKRYPATLSGGEIQRVSLARTMAMEPEILILDEPLSAVDVDIKRSLLQLLKIINEKGQTIVHVTHDINEALSLAKNVSVMNSGEIVQSGSIEDVFENPVNRFVASYCGNTNFFECFIKEKNGVRMVLFEGLKLPEFPVERPCKPGRNIGFIHNRDIRIADKQSSNYCVVSKVTEIKKMYDHIDIHVDAGIDLLLTVDSTDSVIHTGDTLNLYFNPKSFRFIGNEDKLKSYV